MNQFVKGAKNLALGLSFVSVCACSSVENADLNAVNKEFVDGSKNNVNRGNVNNVNMGNVNNGVRENENNVEKFLAEHKDFKAVNPLPFFENTKDMKYVTLFPSMFGSDGFFIAKLQKIKEK